MSQPPPPPPSQPPSGEPSDPKGSGGGYGYPQSPPPPGPPPVQPPAGGFGAPPQPPAGGYGYPQQAPPPPGGAPGFPPQPPPGAGFAPYGHNPQAPGMYQTVPGGPGVPGGGGNGKAIAIVAAAVVAVLAVVTVGFFMITGGEEGGTGGTGGSGGTEGKPSSTEAKELFKIASPRPSEDTLAVPGAWATDDGFAKTTANGVVGMDAASGKQAWKVGFDGPVCAASKHATEDGRTALITAETDSSRAKCTRMVVIDLNEGKKLWQETMPNTDNATSLGMDLTIGDETVAAKWIGGSVAYKITGGSPLWKSDGGFDAKCKDEGYGGGEELVAIVQCGSYAKPKLIVQKVNTKTGKPTWQFTLPDGVQSARIISSDPMVIAAGAGESTVTDVMTIGDDEKLKARISLGDRQYDPRCSTGTESCAAAVVDDEYVYMPSKQHQGDVSSTNEIVAFDIDTGNPKWKSDAGERRTITPVTMDDGKLIAYKPPTYDSGGQVVAVDPGAQGKQELYMRNPDDSADEEGDIAGISMREPPLYSDGRLFIHHTLISQRSVSTYGKNLGLAFGPE